ncbi:MAG: desulfoferrodoxin family protein, partial [Candidatus Saelkia tenebricola]|nr:desulfoferrodoxin family protein [Candidatus Saelkia tenebricola]
MVELKEGGDMRMKRILAVLFIHLFLLLHFNSYADAPKSIDVKVIGNIVKVKVHHHVVNTKMHYVKYINVYVNGRWRVKQRFAYQQDGNYQEAIFNIPSLKKGDVLLIIAHCNKSGRLDKT